MNDLPSELFASPPAPQEAQADTCETCNGHGMIGGPSYYSPDEGGVPCPDCAAPVAQPATEPPGLKNEASHHVDALFARTDVSISQMATEQAEAPSDTLRVACITLDGSTLYIPAKEITDFGIGDDDGETYTLTFKTMTRAEFDALGEFDGF